MGGSNEGVRLGRLTDGVASVASGRTKNYTFTPRPNGPLSATPATNDGLIIAATGKHGVAGTVTLDVKRRRTRGLG